jgi:hypothetical protein
MIKGDVGLIAAGVTKANFSPIQKKFQQEILSIFGKREGSQLQPPEGGTGLM